MTNDEVEQVLKPKWVATFLASVAGAPADGIGPIVAQLLIQEVSPRVDRDGISWDEMEDYHYGYSELVADCAKCMYHKVIDHRHAKKILADCWSYPYVAYDITQYCRETGILDEVEGDELVGVVRAAMKANPKAVEQYKDGKTKAIGAIVGAVMKQQKTDPKKVQEIINKELGL